MSEGVNEIASPTYLQQAEVFSLVHSKVSRYPMHFDWVSG